MLNMLSTFYIHVYTAPSVKGAVCEITFRHWAVSGGVLFQTRGENHEKFGGTIQISS